MEIWKYLIILSVIILLIVLGNKVVYKNDYVVLTGSFALPAAGSLSGSIDINYPTGYTKDNSVVISLMAHGTVNTTWWSTPTDPGFNTALTRGSGNLVANLKPSNITISAQKMDASANADMITYKLILMKI